MIRSYTMRLIPTQRQKAVLSATLLQLCELYNMCLEQRIDAWKTCRKHVGYYDQQAELGILRAACNEYAAGAAAIQRDPLRRLQRAFDGFFRRIRSGLVPGFPRFRSRQRYDSFSLDSQSFRLTDDRIVIIKLGGFRFKTSFRIRGVPKQAHVRRVGGKWRAVIVCDIGPTPEKHPIRSAAGIDVGVSALATLSDGAVIDNPRWAKQETERLAQANRKLAHKVSGSRGRTKAKERLRRVHQRIAGRRRTYLHEVSRVLLANYDLIAHEKLDIAGLAETRLAKSILDAAWGELIRILTYKAEEAGKWVVPVDPRGTTQICSGCGERVPKKLWQRQHDCPKCGLSLGRDHNAALNILERGRRSVGILPAGGSM